MIRRSLIVTPGNVEAKLAKAESFPVDILMLDLEDGVPNTAEAKARARELLGAALSPNRFKAREPAIRINGPKSEWFLDDIRFVCGLDIPTVVVPMVEDVEDMIYVERTLSAMGAPDRLRLILLIETPAGVLNLQKMVEASPRTNGLIAGGLDYALTTHSLSILPPLGNASKNGTASRHDDDLLFMRQQVLAVARAYGLSAIDAMRPGELADLDAFRADAEYSRWLGFDGLDFYHPAFIDIANDVFTPSVEELEWADKVLGANEGGDSGAAASRKVDGRVILPQHIEIAGRLRSLADTIAAD
ncbi:MAG: CoA ester lyase [Rhodospirillaceae bacterium]|nr:CoA ester lyase [Rhodospirillaceae bacterium]